MFGETPLLFVYFEACHYNSMFPTKMPLNMYGHSLGPAASIYKDVYFISPITDTWAPHVIFFFLSLSLSLWLSLSIPTRPRRALPVTAAAGEPVSRYCDPARRG